jgi:hypothetical protein
MASHKVVSRKCLPIKIPTYQAATVFLLCDRFNAPGWLYGVLGTVFGLLIIGGIVITFQEKQCDIFKPEDGDHG